MGPLPVGEIGPLPAGEWISMECGGLAVGLRGPHGLAGPLPGGLVGPAELSPGLAGASMLFRGLAGASIVSPIGLDGASVGLSMPSTGLAGGLPIGDSISCGVGLSGLSGLLALSLAIIPSGLAGSSSFRSMSASGLAGPSNDTSPAAGEFIISFSSSSDWTFIPADRGSYSVSMS